MIIETKYKDIPFEELPHKIQPLCIWENFRGKKVLILTPPTENVERFDDLCQGPFYQIVDQPLVVCPHIAEIGD